MALLDAVEPERRRVDALRLSEIFREVAGFEPVVWGDSIVGCGPSHYVCKPGREGYFLATGFSPRRTGLKTCILPGYADFGDILKRLGKHGTGRSCLYINRLDAVDEDVLRELIAAGLRDLGTRWAVAPS